MCYVKFIYATNPVGVFGNKNKLPWNLREDLLQFKEKTLFQTVMMGSKTYDSLPESIKPLPNRKSIIVTSQHDKYKHCGDVISDPIKYISKLKHPIWVIGGASLLTQLKDFCIEVHHTEVYLDVEGDAHFSMDLTGWDVISDSGLLISKNNINYTTTVYRKPI